jgi:hypothetical protein
MGWRLQGSRLTGCTFQVESSLGAGALIGDADYVRPMALSLSNCAARLSVGSPLSGSRVDFSSWPALLLCANRLFL